MELGKHVHFPGQCCVKGRKCSVGLSRIPPLSRSLGERSDRGIWVGGGTTNKPNLRPHPLTHLFTFLFSFSCCCGRWCLFDSALFSIVLPTGYSILTGPPPPQTLLSVGSCNFGTASTSKRTLARWCCRTSRGHGSPTLKSALLDQGFFASLVARPCHSQFPQTGGKRSTGICRRILAIWGECLLLLLQSQQRFHDESASST